MNPKDSTAARTSTRILGAALLLVMTSAGPRRSFADGEAPPRPTRDEFLGTWVEIVRRGIARPDTDAAVFHGSFDWHSAVHGHWAILRVARSTGKHADAAEEVDRSLSTEGLARAAPEKQRARFAAAYEAHVRAGTRDHDRFAGDFRAYDHWVPQFAIYALTDGD